MKKKKIRHILGLSGGKDSTALAVLLHKEIPDLEFFFCDTHKELDETYNYLEMIKARLGIKITYLSAEKGFDFWLEVYGGYLPSPRSRWCTRKLKIEPLEKFVGNDDAISYVGIRADEDRSGYVSTKENIKAVFPFKERGLIKSDIFKILEETGIGLPEYYKWRSRSGCFFCFFQRKYEWVMLSEKHPNLFKEAMKYEEDHKDGRVYTWNERETLKELLARKDDIIAEYEEAIKREKKNASNKPLIEVFTDIMDGENLTLPCLMCI